MDTDDLKFIIDKVDDVREELNGRFDKLSEENNRKMEQILTRLSEKADCVHSHPSYICKEDFFEQFISADEKYREKKDNIYLRKGNKINLTVNLLKSLTPYVVIVVLIVYTILRSTGQIAPIPIIP